MKLVLPPAWSEFLAETLANRNFDVLSTGVSSAYEKALCYPPKALLFEAFNLCPPAKVKVVLLGQDPYHGPGQAHGLSFSVPFGQKLPPSLKNIFKELVTDLPAFEMPLSGDLSGWAQQGVLLLNAVLSVEAGKPGSHKHLNWEWFTDEIISKISAEKSHVVFLLWGNYARSKARLIDASKHLVLEAAHPSPLARGAFFGSQPFSQCNAYLRSVNETEITW